MKHIMILGSVVVFLFITGCNKNKNAAAVTPPTAACTDDVSLQNLSCLSGIAQQICCGEYSNTMTAYAPYCAAVTSPQASVGGYQLPAPPVPPAPQPQLPPQIPGCAPVTTAMTCDQAITNFELQYRSTYSTCQNAASKQWHDQQGAAVVTCVGNNAGITSTEQLASSAQAQCQASLTYSTATPVITSQVPAGIAIPGPVAPVAPSNGLLSGSTSSVPAALDTSTPLPVTTVTQTNPILPTETVATTTTTAGVPAAIEGQGLTSGQVVRLGADAIPNDYQ